MAFSWLAGWPCSYGVYIDYAPVCQDHIPGIAIYISYTVVEAACSNRPPAETNFIAALQ